MKTFSLGLTGAVIALVVGLTATAGPPAFRPKPDAEAQPVVEKRISVAEARERARLMHDIYLETLEVMHKYYFRREGAVLPARAIEEVFTKVDRKGT